MLLDRHVAPAVRSLMTCSDWKFPLETRGGDYEVIGLLCLTLTRELQSSGVCVCLAVPAVL